MRGRTLFGRIIEKFAAGILRVFILCAVVSSVIVLSLYITKPGFLTIVGLKATDVMFQQRGVIKPPENVVIVAVDERSVNELGRWPWTRVNIASLIRGLKDAKVVAFDIVFSEKENVKNDAILMEAIKESGNVVLGYFFRDDSTEAPNEKSLKQMERSKIHIMRFLDPKYTTGDIDVPEFKWVEPNIEEIGDYAAGFGSFNILPDTDGSYRTANLVYRYGDGFYPPLSIEALRKYAGSDMVFTIGPYGFVESLAIGEYTAPLDEGGGFTLNFYGPGGTFTTYPAVDVIKGRINPDTFKDKIVFVGVTEKAVYDIRVTPVDALYPGVEVHATVAGNILEKRFLINDYRTWLLDVLFIILLPIILALVVSKVRRTYLSLPIFAVFSFSIIIAVYFLFSSFNLVLSDVYPLFSLSLTYLSIEAYRNVVVERKSKFYRKAFSTYVPPQVVSEIIKDPGRLKLGGEKRVISVLFSDIRGFTGLAEKISPENLVTLLNEYLTPMTEMVFKEEGTLDKYIGDAIMAIFNAPMELKNHPKRACMVAYNMVRKLPELNMEWQKRGFPAINIGVGINTGEAVVGNMGAELRFDYTAIGDTVNLASRFEGLNKTYGTNITVSEFTYKDCKDDFIFRELDLVRVKGKENPVGVFELMGTKGEDKQLIADSFKEALTNYRKGKFKTAKKGFEDILDKYPDDGPTVLYIERCDEYIETPPPQDWDGVYTARTK